MLSMLSPAKAELVPVQRIDKTWKVWHVRTHTRDEEEARLAHAISATGRVVPVHVVRQGGGAYSYISGLLRILAVERLGQEAIPAYVEHDSDPELLLRIALAEQEAVLPVKTLERGWALDRLQRLRKNLGLPHRQCDLAEITGMDRGTVSAALKAAHHIPQAVAETYAIAAGIGLGEVAHLGRESIRIIAGASSQQDRSHLLRVACDAVANNNEPGRAVREANSVLRNSADSAVRSKERHWARRVWARLQTLGARVIGIVRRLVRSGRGEWPTSAKRD